MYITTQRPLAKGNPKYWVGRPDLGKPDTDNTEKLIKDALNGLAYKDDKQITKTKVTKLSRSAHGCNFVISVRLVYFTEKYVKE